MSSIALEIKKFRNSPRIQVFLHYWKLLVVLSFLAVISTYHQAGRQQDTFNDQRNQRGHVYPSGLPVIVPLHKERIFTNPDGDAMIATNSATSKLFYRVRLIPFKQSGKVAIVYEKGSPPESMIVFGKYSDHLHSSEKLKRGLEILDSPQNDFGSIKRYFQMLKTPTGHCKKMVRMGGQLCSNGTGDESHMDGNKLICIDPALQITGSKRTEDCLVLSFGMNYDTTFDERALDANCEIHMFDIFDYPSDSNLRQQKHVYFHQLGLGVERGKIFYSNINATVEVDSFNGIAFNLSLNDRLINIFKIDIEGKEWDIFESIAQKAFMNVIGQIAIEVHGISLTEVNQTEGIKLAKKYQKTLLALQERGFERVSYWDNHQPSYVFRDVDGVEYDSSGELLLVNSNWYNDSFRKEAIDFGYNFKQRY